MAGEALQKATENSAQPVDVVAQVADLMDPEKSGRLLEQGKELLLDYVFLVRVWEKSGVYWKVLFDANEAGIEIPYPTMDVNLRRVEQG